MKTILRKRVQVDCSTPVLTDQSYKKASDINNIMKQYAKTGILPDTGRIGQFIDTTNIPSLEEAHNIMNEAKMLFKQLPSNLRKLIDNDPKKLLGFLNDPKNTDFLIKEGVLEKKAQVITNDAQTSESTSVNNSALKAE